MTRKRTLFSVVIQWLKLHRNLWDHLVLYPPPSQIQDLDRVVNAMKDDGLYSKKVHTPHLRMTVSRLMRIARAS